MNKQIRNFGWFTHIYGNNLEWKVSFLVQCLKYMRFKDQEIKKDITVIS